jgi:8-oxo-dGTP pyrophosphatase MutT (NUDIX family)
MLSHHSKRSSGCSIRRKRKAPTANYKYADPSPPYHLPHLQVARAAGCIILVSQWRPPANGSVLEFPAGLVDDGETVEAAALRELREETGYTGK